MKRNMKLLISLLLLVTVMPSCIYDEEPQDIDLTDGIRMGFTICTAGDTSTRGQNDPTENGSDLENKIDIENRDFRVYFYKTDNDSYIGELEVMMVNRLEEEGKYYVMGKIAGDNMESLPTSFRVVVMANLEKWEGYPTQPAYGTNIEAYSYGDNGYCVSEDKLIPMWGWGCCTYTDVTSQKGVVTQLDTPVNMLRAFAKIEVIDATTDSDLRLTEVSLKGHSTQFYIQPAASGYTGGNTNADFDQCNIPENSSDTQTALKFTEDKDTSTEGTDPKKKFVLYVPEYTTTDSSSPMTLTVKFGNGVERDIDLSKELSDNPITTLLRNHIYRFKVSLKQGELSIYYQGIPWEKKDEISIESGCDYDYNQSTNN